MKNIVGMGIIILAVLLLISPVAAWTPSITKSCPEQACTNCPMTCTITAKFASHSAAYIGKVTDTLPSDVTGISAPDGVIVGNVVTWDNIAVPQAGLTKILTVTFTTPSAGTFVNNAAIYVRDNSGVWRTSLTRTASSRYTTEICTPSPEFPTLALPVGLIIGMLGVVLFVQRSKEN